MRRAMIGTGYVGLVSGACFSDFGHVVTCIDKDAGKIRELQKGSCRFSSLVWTPSLPAMLRPGGYRLGANRQRPCARPTRYSWPWGHPPNVAMVSPTSHTSTTPQTRLRRQSLASRSSRSNRPCRSEPTTRSTPSFESCAPMRTFRSRPIRSSCAKAPQSRFQAPRSRRGWYRGRTSTADHARALPPALHQ